MFSCTPKLTLVNSHSFKSRSLSIESPLTSESYKKNANKMSYLSDGISVVYKGSKIEIEAFDSSLSQDNKNKIFEELLEMFKILGFRSSDGVEVVKKINEKSITF